MLPGADQVAAPQPRIKGVLMPAKSKKIPSSVPVRVEVRVDGRVRLAQLCYDPHLEIAEDGSTVKFSAALQPVLVSAAPPRPPERFEDDPRHDEEMIPQVHSGRRNTAQKKAAAKASEEEEEEAAPT